jgi:predicted flap endonuclease-1-like 5' DNA nuclease
MTQIEDIEGIGPAYAEKLTAAGVKTTEALLDKAAKAAGRKALAEATGFSEKQILEWVNRADLARVKGVGSEFADLLEAAGVDSPTELAQRVPANLFAKLESVNAEQKLVRRTPSQGAVERWIAEAKTMPKVVEH